MKTITILIVLILVFLSFGCIGNNTESKNASTGDAVQTTNTETPVAADPVITPTPDVTPTLIVYQDAEWGQSVQRSALSLSTDFTNAADASEKNDYTTLGIEGQNIVDDTQKALDENDQYSVSPKYQDAKKEWVLALNDHNSAGKYLVLVADDGKIGKSNPENVKNVISLCNSGTEHMKKATALIEAQKKQ